MENVPNSTSGVTPSEGSTPSASVPTGPTKPVADEGASKQAFSTMDQIKKEDPKVYKAMMEGIAARIINQMKKMQARLKKAMREGQRRN